jgi:maleamate amidohydrolase
LTAFLTDLGADSLIVVGTTTSGCVRGSVVDAFSYNYRVAVVEEGCFDRADASHALSLCDMHAKYADVIGLDEALQFIRSLPDDLFPNRPTGVAR